MLQMDEREREVNYIQKEPTHTPANVGTARVNTHTHTALGSDVKPASQSE